MSFKIPSFCLLSSYLSVCPPLPLTGWLYHTVPQVASHGETPNIKAIELLKLAVGANPSCGQAWYFLGRCHADQGQFKEAFVAYRQSINKVEKQPDTWCAIG